MRLTLAALAALHTPAAFAADLQVFPIRLDLSASESTSMITVSNRGTADALVQLGMFAWSQPEGQDVLTPTRDILVNPAVFLVKAGSQQIARFGLRVPQDATERPYRIVLQEVPPQQASGQGLTTALRIVMPLFVQATAPKPAMTWRLLPGAGGKVALMATNTGNVHVQIRSVKLSASGPAATTQMLATYVLPGMSRTIALDTNAAFAAGTMLHLEIDSDQGGMSADVRMEAGTGRTTGA